VRVETEYIEITAAIAGIPQGSVIRLLLYTEQTSAGIPQGSVIRLLLYTEQTSTESTTPTFVDDATLLDTDSDPGIASQKEKTNTDAKIIVREMGDKIRSMQQSPQE
jgi:hypothetical protein